ncbi:Crp/Fnr family transcriptional regulator [Reyranella sp. CPCC 100927]|uniref:Crp/Fnr family transcriptional regulator n=1 Tax=Reyranella sp. CPCC 100927 TaxID=2599616 RepID=UPI0011B737E5|nr:Crp/Fnr family transcriptional regulator [Reyranella sp. CPCC 100927]TWT13710.1 Crp/Fnr family transcriptional regulator [Reyranella sp. CPCC 100927]
MPRKATGAVRPIRKAGKAVAAARASKATKEKTRPAGGRNATANGFDARRFLTSVGAGRSSVNHSAKAIVFQQGGPADAVFYIQKGRIQLTVVSEHGKEGVVAILGPGDFFGEGCLAGQPLHISSASAMTAASVIRIEKETMIRVLHEQPGLSEMFMAFLLSRNIQIEADLIDQLFNSSERRLARLLLLLANFGKAGTLETVIPKVSQELLAARIGTTRSRINFFMNKFRKLGFIEYNGGLKVHSSLLRVVIHD